MHSLTRTCRRDTKHPEGELAGEYLRESVDRHRARKCMYPCRTVWALHSRSYVCGLTGGRNAEKKF